MDYSGELANSLKELQMANVAYYKSLNVLKECKEARSACFKDFKDFQRFKNQPSVMDSKRKALDEATFAGKTAEKDLERSRTELRIKQSAYDKLKRLAISQKKAQKDSVAREKKQRERAKDQHKQKWEEEQKRQDQEETEQIEEENARNEENKEKQRQGETRRKYWKDGYKEKTSPENPRQPRKTGKSSRSTNPETPKLPSEWMLVCDKALRERATMTLFPDPPYSGCGLVGCASTRNQRALKACQCNIAKALQRDPDYPESLKRERLRWHPDKFSICSEEQRAEFQAKAKEIFVVVNHLYERDGKANHGN